MFIDCVFVVLRITAACPHSHCQSGGEGKKKNEIWGSIELGKDKCGRKISPHKAKLTGLWSDHYSWGGASGGRGDDTAHPVQHFSCNGLRRNRWDCVYTKDRARRQKAVHAAICLKKAGSITNQGSREGQDEHGGGGWLSYTAPQHV